LTDPESLVDTGEVRVLWTGRYYTGRKGRHMTTLLDLEPREAGLLENEPRVSFDAAGTATQDRTRCVGCCVDSSEEVLATHSATQG
jgi:hypothetical protein